MIYYRSFRFFTWLCVYTTLVVKGVITDQDDVDLDSIEMKILSLAKASNSTEEDDNNYNCLTAECNSTAFNILENMDPTVNPCDDFYKFACGGFVSSHVLGNIEKYSAPTLTTKRVVLEQLRTIIEGESPPNEPRPFRLVKDFYKACVNEHAIDTRGLQSLLDNIRKLGGWPVLEGYHQSSFNWMNSIYEFRRFGYSINYFIDFEIINTKNITSTLRHAIRLSQPSFGLAEILLIRGFNDRRVQTYYDYMVGTAVLLGADRSKAAEELRESLEFEIQLANISHNTRYNVLDKPMTVNELSTAYPSIPWSVEHFNNLLAPILQVTTEEAIIVNIPSFLEEFEILINATPKRVLENYALWRVVHESAEFTAILRKRMKQFNRIEEPRWTQCIRLVSHRLDFAVGFMYFNWDARENVLEMIGNIQDGFEDMFEKVTWMDKETKERALEKVDSIKSNVVYPNEFLDIGYLNKLYEKLELKADDALGNKLNVTIFETNHQFELLNKAVDKNEWWRHELVPTTVGAFYSPKYNSIQIPVGTMRGVYLNKNRPRYMDYGAIGSIIGHEITHGIDDKGRLYDEDGYIVDWWDQETKGKFLDRVQCMISQYGNYTGNFGTKLNGSSTLSENIADNGGVKAAYYGYKEWAEDNGIEQGLHGLPFTPEQMFWISYANSLCTKYESRLFRILMGHSSHSPDEFRVKGPLSNMEEFARDFNCNIGTKMNPENKCIIW